MWKGAILHAGGLKQFFRLGLQHESIGSLMTTNFHMLQQHKYSLTELENMIPWERDIYIDMLARWIEEENQRIQNEINKMK